MPDAVAASATSHDAALRAIFLEARTHFAWQDRAVPDALLREIWDVARMGPTSTNGSPMRVIFVKSDAARERLKPGIKPGNLAKTMAAPVTAITAFDLDFYENFDRLAPYATDRIAAYREDPDLAYRAAFRNATLQAAYFMIVARAKGLDCGPMSGFLHDVVDETFFAGTNLKSNFLINLGYGDPSVLFPRQYRFAFDEACSVI
ncbi:MAG: malonic semialdehyde reductase [Rhodobacteraceae bacterium]|nr:malonic semialdehyde reductase [Paracoccaceae bacterium]MBR9822540.1 malonic semialdehyde reductase [Paracoccaceae bacterium]